ncbi:MAG: GntR family transcriptional regulator [Candidatus Nanopelagicales bacterium]
MLGKAQLESASDVAAQSLFDAIVDGRIPPGSPLRLKELSEQLGMSMMPVREAIRRLAALDLVEIEPRKGARVRDMTLGDLQDTYFSRIHLEGIAVWEAAKRFTSDDEARAREALADRAQAQLAGDRVAERDAHERFHFALYAASRRVWIVRSILPAWRNSERYRVGALRKHEIQPERDNEHEQLLDALTRGDGGSAVQWLVAHLQTSVRLSAESLSELGGDGDLTEALPSASDVLSGVKMPDVTSETPLLR